MFDLCNWIIETAKSAGADDCKVYISRNRFVDIENRERKLQTVKEATTQSINLSLYVNGRYSSQSTSDLRKESLKKFIAMSLENTGLLEEDPFRSLPDPKYYEGRAEIDLKKLDPNYGLLTPEKRKAIIKEIEDACYLYGGDKIVSVTTSVYDDNYEEILITSNGFEGSEETTICWAGAQVTVQDEGDRRPTAYNYVGNRFHEKMPDLKEIGKNAALRALNLLGAKKIETQTVPIIVENKNVGRILWGFLSALYGWNVQQKRSFLADKKGQKVGSDLFTLIDDPHIVGALGSCLYDGDGFHTKKRTFIEKGVVNEFLIDWYRSRKLGWEPTTGNTTNLFIPKGTRSVEEIMKDLGKGVYITGFLGGNSNSTTGDASVGILGHLFENGKLTQPIAEMNIAFNHLEFWNKLIEVANDPYIYSSWQMPSLVFSDVVVSGI